MRAFVYFNLHRRCWSVKALEGEHKGHVVEHATHLTLTDCRFKVSEAGRQRVISEQRKNVHAGIVGNVVDLQTAGDGVAVDVTYNPYKAGTFVAKATGCPVHTATVAKLNAATRGVYAYGVR